MHAQILEGLRNRDAEKVRSGLIADIEAAGRVMDELLEPESAETGSVINAIDSNRGIGRVQRGRPIRAHMGEDPWAQQILASLDGRSVVKIGALLEELGLHPDGRQQASGQRIGRILQSLGWTRKQLREQGKPVRVYVRAADVR